MIFHLFIELSDRNISYIGSLFLPFCNINCIFVAKIWLGRLIVYSWFLSNIRLFIVTKIQFVWLVIDFTDFARLFQLPLKSRYGRDENSKLFSLMRLLEFCLKLTYRKSDKTVYFLLRE